MQNVYQNPFFSEVEILSHYLNTYILELCSWYGAQYSLQHAAEQHARDAHAGHADQHGAQGRLLRGTTPHGWPGNFL